MWRHVARYIPFGQCWIDGGTFELTRSLSSNPTKQFHLYIKCSLNYQNISIWGEKSLSGYLRLPRDKIALFCVSVVVIYQASDLRVE